MAGRGEGREGWRGGEKEGGMAGRREGRGMEEGRGNGKCGGGCLTYIILVRYFQGGPARFTPKMNLQNVTLLFHFNL